MTLWLRLRAAKSKAATIITNAAIIATGFMRTRVSMAAWMLPVRGRNSGVYPTIRREKHGSLRLNAGRRFRNSSAPGGA